MAKAELMNYEQALEKFEVVIGLEVHVELNTNTKMFCGCRNDFGDEPNTNVCPICIGLPGSLPAVNRKAVESSIAIGLALGCEIAPNGRFSRKNYFYPALAKNFQTSQYDEPIAFEGTIDIEVPSGAVYTVDIERAHMEEDAGKLTHIGGNTGRIQGAEYSLVDYNRAGVPLVEIVTKPVFGAGAEGPELAAAYVRSIREIVKALGVSDAWNAETFVATPTFRFARTAKRSSAPGPKPRTSTRFAQSSVRFVTRFSAKHTSSPTAEPSFKRPATGTKTAA